MCGIHSRVPVYWGGCRHRRPGSLGRGPEPSYRGGDPWGCLRETLCASPSGTLEPFRADGGLRPESVVDPAASLPEQTILGRGSGLWEEEKSRPKTVVPISSPA